MENLFLYLAIISILVIGLAVLWRCPAQAAVISVLLATVLDCLQVAEDGINIGVNIYIRDIACFVLLIAALIGAMQRVRLPDKTSWPVFALFGLVSLNFARGAAEFGINAAGNGARSLAYLVIPLVSSMLLGSAAQIDARRLAKWVCVAGSILALIAVCRWIGILPMPKVDFDEQFREALPRVLPADYAMVIGQALLGIVYLQVGGRLRWSWVGLAGVLAATTFALQHRSVWGATCVGLAWMAMRTAKFAAMSWLRLAVLAFIGCVSIAMIAGPDRIDRVVSIARANFEETQQRDNTWRWRVKGFTEATDRVFSGDAFEAFVGPPSGRDLTFEASFASVHIHNRYISILAYYGVIGMMIFVLWLAAIGRKIGQWSRAEHQSPDRSLSAAFLQALLLTQLTYFVAYAGEIMQGAIMGLIWLAAETCSPRKIVLPRGTRMQPIIPVMRL